MTSNNSLPLAGTRVVEFSHMVMGPSTGLILADLGAEVVKIEPLGGDKTRRLRGSGAGYFSMYNRNKRSLCVDLKSDAGRDVAMRLVRRADVLVENFRPGAMEKLGYGYEAMAAENPGLIYCSARGFLKGPYEHRTALDEVAQMMGGLAYMTGPPGRPLRAGASVIDVVGGMFGAIGVLAALQSRNRSGKGDTVTSALFESTVFLVGQHMAQYAVTGTPASPMPVRISAWAVYDIFDTADNQQVFVAVVSDTQWVKFCADFGLEDFARDDSLRENASRVAQRDRVIPAVRKLFLDFTKDELMQRLEACGLPYAGIGRPEDMFEDPHLLASGGLLDITTPEGTSTRLPALPLQMHGERFGVRQDVPRQGEHSRAILTEAGYDEQTIASLIDSGIIENA